MSNTFFIADLHLGHTNIIKYCNRPFETVEEMDETIIKNWNSVVKEGDVVYLLGDFCFHKNPQEYLDRLNGEIRLIKGNHDKSKILKAFKDVSALITIKIDDKIVVLCHYPMLTWDRARYGSIHLYGHIHNKIRKSEPNSYCVSVECIDYTPKTLKQILERKNNEKI